MHKKLTYRLVLASVALAMVAAACGDDDDDASDTTTTAAPETTTTAAPETTTTTTTTDAPDSTTTLPALAPIKVTDVANHHCAIDETFYLVVADELPEGTPGFEANAEDLKERYADSVAARGDNTVTSEELGPILVRGSDNEALNAINTLRGRGIDARPLYYFAFQGHWSLEPGGDPAFGVAIEGAVADTVDAQRTNTRGSNNTIMVVDAGFTNLPTETGKPISPRDAFAIHGTFVKQIVRSIAPGSNVVEAPVVPVEAGFQPLWMPSADYPLPDDYSVADAILKAIGGYSGKSADLVLNLSLGTYGCRDEQGNAVPPARIEYILETVVASDTSVIAAGGNDYFEAGAPPFYPAAFGEVTGVGSWDSQQKRVLWQTTSPNRWEYQNAADDPVSWDVVAPGLDLIAYPAQGGALRWSGSSFATAVYSGLIAASCSPSDSTLYDEVPGLVHFDTSQDAWVLSTKTGC